MEDTANFDGAGISAGEEEPVVADAEPEFFFSLESFYVAFAGIRETMQSGKNTHGGGLVQAADIGLGRVCPEDMFHFGSW